MKIVVITGPSGSGKTFLSNKLANYFENTIIVKTDSYYRDNIFIKLSSIICEDIYDRSISIKKKELTKTISSIYKKDKSTIFYNYDFKSKTSSKSKRKIQFENNCRFLILEGIFAHRLKLNYSEAINILCKEKKEICYQRRLKRDQLKRGRDRKEINRKFCKSWDLFYKNLPIYINYNEAYEVNTADKISYIKLINKIKSINSH